LSPKNYSTSLFHTVGQQHSLQTMTSASTLLR
jgi:hypothetical protein